MYEETLEGKIELIEKLWNDSELVNDFVVSNTTNSIYIRFSNNKWVRISDHDKKQKFNWIDINLDIWKIHSILNRISGNKYKWSYKRYIDYDRLDEFWYKENYKWLRKEY